MESTSSDIILYIILGIVSIGVLVIIFLGLRGINLWYWKINERLAEQKKTNELLSEIRDSLKK